MAITQWLKAIVILTTEFATEHFLILVLSAICNQSNSIVFKNSDLTNYFNKFECYIPNPNLRMEEITLTKDEKKLINEITAREKLIK